MTNSFLEIPLCKKEVIFVTVAIRLLRTGKAFGDRKLKFNLLYCNKNHQTVKVLKNQTNIILLACLSFSHFFEKNW